MFNNLRLSLSISLFVLFLINIPYKTAAADKNSWKAPAKASSQANPISVSESSLAAGQKIYAKRCEKCHGKTGKGDGPDAADLAIEPASFTSSEVINESDGALFWKIQTGKKPMPKYSSRLSSEEIWNVINYMRTLSHNVMPAK